MPGTPAATPVVLVSTAKAGGAERALASLARHLPALGFRPVAVLLEEGPLRQWLAGAGCDQVVAAAPGAQVAELVRGLVRATGARVVVSNKWQSHVHGGAAALAEGLPAVWWQHDIAKRRPRHLAAAAIPAAAIVCTSDHALRAQRALTPDGNLVKVHPGVPVDEIAARAGTGAAVRRSLGWEAGPIVGIVGRVERVKRQHVFLEAAALVARRRPDARFLVVGGPPLTKESSYPEQVRRLAAELGIADRVGFTGHQDDVPPWIDAMDVVVSTTDGEAFGLVVAEAMALGTPVVAAAVGGPTEIVEDGESGLLAPPGRAEALAAAIGRVLDDGELAGRLARGGRERARLYTEERMAEEMAELLRTIAVPQVPCG